ncbi:MAG: radical SAM protein [Spirochaetes bacterium]|nr:radical SAM protein [Spirochaetota bacterium]MBU1079039.1 radical SAM protein [Spirochaetota bacterium]
MEPFSVFDERNGAFFRRARRAAMSRALSPAALSGGLRGLAGSVRSAVRLAATAAFQGGQARKRAAAAAAGRSVPGILIASVTRRCNLDCAGCYSKALRPGAAPELSDERFEELFREAAEMGVGTFLVAGGEPLVRMDLLERIAGLRGPAVAVFTNGTLFDETAEALFARSGMVPIFSVEGDEAFTAARRGEGIHEKALAAAAGLKRRGAPFGLSVTLTSRNADLALSDAFLGRVAELGASVLFLIEYVPVQPGTDGLVLEARQKALLDDATRFSRRPFMTVSLPGDEEAFGGCLAAGRGFIHLAADGSLEACPFAPFSDSNAGAEGLAAALASPLMREIRSRHAELTETRGGCALWNKRGWVASLGSCRADAGRATA